MSTATLPAPVETPAPNPDDSPDVYHLTDSCHGCLGRWLAGEPGVTVTTLCGLVASDGDTMHLDEPTGRMTLCSGCDDARRMGL